MHLSSRSLRHASPQQHNCTRSMLCQRSVMLCRVHCASNSQKLQGAPAAAELTSQQQAHLAALQQTFTPLEVDKLVSSRPDVLDLPTNDWLRFFEGYGLSKAVMWRTLR